MRAVNYSTLRENLKMYMDAVTDDYETLIITRKNNRNIVMISEESYNNMLENMYLMSDKANYDWITDSIAQWESGKVTEHELFEDENA